MLCESERQRQLRFGIALRRIQLGLDEKDTPGEVGASEVGISEVGPEKVGHSQVGASEVSSNEVCPSQVGASEVGAFEFGPDEIGSSVVLLLGPDFGSREFARAPHQGMECSSGYCPVQLRYGIR